MLLSPLNVNEFLKRFYHCYDGLIREIKIDFTTKKAVILVSAQERAGSENLHWVNLKLDVKNVDNFTLVEDKSTCIVLSNGIKVGFFENKAYVDLCPYTDEPTGVDDFRKSNFLIVGGQCFWSVTSTKPATIFSVEGQGPLTSLPDTQTTQSNEMFNFLTYRRFLDHYGQLFVEYSQLYERHLQHKALQERLHAPELEEMDLLDEQFEQWRIEYLNRLPSHLIASCPYCSTSILQPVDNFSLIGFHPLLNLADFYHGNEMLDIPLSTRHSCKHVITTAITVSLNNLKPNDLPQWAINRKWLYMSSSPRVMVWPLVARRTSAVIHSLPIGRLDDPEPIHRYSIYFITYFMDDISNLMTKEMWVATDLGAPATEGVKYDHDLRKWVEAGRLYWLDSNNPFRLVKSPVDEFPYYDVQPQGRYRIIENGEVEGPHPYNPHFTWQGNAPHHNESFPQTIE